VLDLFTYPFLPGLILLPTLNTFHFFSQAKFYSREARAQEVSAIIFSFEGA